MINTDYTKEVKDIVNVSTAAGEEHVGGSVLLTHKMTLPSYKLFDHGVITYQRACELFRSKAPGNDYKTLANKTHLRYTADGDYFRIVYNAERIIEIHRHGWLIHAPQYRDILYPGYTTRVEAYTGVCVYKRVIRGGVKVIEYGSPRYKSFVSPHGFAYTHASRNRKYTPEDNLGRDRNSVFVDFSFKDKNPFTYYMGLTNLQPHTNVNGRKESRLGWWRGADHNGRIRANFGSPSKLSHFVQDIIKGYVTGYLSAVINRNTSYKSETCPFTDFITSEEYRYNFVSSNAGSINHSLGSYRYTVRDELPRFHSDQSDRNGYMSSPSLYKIDVLNSILTNSKSRNHKVLGGLPGYTTLTQAIFAMRGFKFIPDINTLKFFTSDKLDRLNAQLEDSDPIFQWHRDLVEDSEYMALEQLMPKAMDKLTLTSHDRRRSDYNWYNKDMLVKYQQFFSPELLSNFALRESLVLKFFQHMCCLSSLGPEKTPYSVQQMSSMYHSTREFLNSSYAHENGSVNGSYFEFSTDQIDQLRKGHGRFSGQTPFAKLVNDQLEDFQRRIDNGKKLRNVPGGYLETPWVPFLNSTNPYPRLIFFVMFDEYLNSVLYDKNTLVDMLIEEWKSIDTTSADKIHRQVSQGDMPISYDIMYSFLNKRFGMFMYLLDADRLYARQADLPVRRIYGGINMLKYEANRNRNGSDYNYGYYYSSEPLNDHMFPAFNIESDPGLMNNALLDADIIKAYRDGEIPRNDISQ